MTLKQLKGSRKEAGLTQIGLGEKLAKALGKSWLPNTCKGRVNQAESGRSPYTEEEEMAVMAIIGKSIKLKSRKEIDVNILKVSTEEVEKLVEEAFILIAELNQVLGGKYDLKRLMEILKNHGGGKVSLPLLLKGIRAFGMVAKSIQNINIHCSAETFAQLFEENL